MTASSQDNPVRVIDAFIGGIDLDEADFKRAAHNMPADLHTILKLFLNPVRMYSGTKT